MFPTPLGGNVNEHDIVPSAIFLAAYCILLPTIFWNFFVRHQWSTYLIGTSLFVIERSVHTSHLRKAPEVNANQLEQSGRIFASYAASSRVSVYDKHRPTRIPTAHIGTGVHINFLNTHGISLTLIIAICHSQAMSSNFTEQPWSIVHNQKKVEIYQANPETDFGSKDTVIWVLSLSLVL
jgi:hypothetical protein